MHFNVFVNIILQHFLPNEDDWSSLRSRMEIITQRILQTNFDVFSTADIEMHIKHQYSKESILISEIVRNHYIFYFFWLTRKRGRQ